MDCGTDQLQQRNFLLELQLESSGFSFLLLVIERIKRDSMDKGVVAIRYENGKVITLPKSAYLKMKNAGRKVDLVEEASTNEELREKLIRRFGRLDLVS